MFRFAIINLMITSVYYSVIDYKTIEIKKIIKKYYKKILSRYKSI